MYCRSMAAKRASWKRVSKEEVKVKLTPVMERRRKNE